MAWAVLFLALLGFLENIVAQQTAFITELAAFSSLAFCAAGGLSVEAHFFTAAMCTEAHIAPDLASCICLKKSEEASRGISFFVSVSCQSSTSSDASVSAALDVLATYCRLEGNAPPITTATSPASPPESPGSVTMTPSSTLPKPSGTPPSGAASTAIVVTSVLATSLTILLPSPSRSGLSTNTPIASPTTLAQTSSSSGLSTGAAIGIGVGATFGGITIALILFFLWRRRPNRRPQQPQGPATPTIPEPGTMKGPIQITTELGPCTPEPLSVEESAELEQRQRAAELQGSIRMADLQKRVHPRVELEALRAEASVVHELGGQSVVENIQPT